MNAEKIHTLFKYFEVSNNDQLRAIYNKLSEDHGIRRGPAGLLNITDRFDDHLYQAERFMRRVESTTELPYEVTTTEHGKQIRENKPYNNILKRIVQWIRAIGDDLKYSPHIECLRKCILSSNLPYGHPLLYPSMLVGDITVAECVNDLVQQMRKVMSTRTFKEQIRHRSENCFRAFRSAVKYIDSLFTGCSRLLHVRVDLSLKREVENDEESEYQDGLTQILCYWKVMVNKIKHKSQPFHHLQGYIAHLEYGYEKGHHLHISFFYDGHKRHRDSNIAHDIIALWESITENHGISYSTNLSPQTPACNALGEIHRDDAEKRDCLYYVLWYMAKRDQFLTFKHKDKQRLFFRGTINN